MPNLTLEQKLLFNRLSKDRQQNADVLEKRSMRGVKQRVIEKYSDNAHFIYELLQNADDVKATKARFILNQSGIYFAHNGTIHFSITAPDCEEIDTQNQCLGHINAITSIGNSNKYEAQIGKFGVGFKAVFQYTQTPEIYDPSFCFKIERFIVPILLTTEHPERQPDETLFYFPFDNPQQTPHQAFQAIVNKLTHLSYPLLFLRNLTEITWFCSHENQGKYLKTIKPLEVNNTHYHIELISGSHAPAWEPNPDAPASTFSKSNHFLVLTDNTNNHPFSIAYLVNLSEHGQPIQILHEQTFPAYCFFPTKETTHLQFIVQAPFLLTDSREGIKQTNPWNQQLVKALAQLIANSITIIKALGLLTDDFFNVLPINASDFPTEHLFAPIYQAVLTQLQSQTALLPTKTGNYTTRDNAYLAENPHLMHLLSEQQLNQLVNHKKAQWVFPQTTHHQKGLWDYVKHHLVNQEITSDKLVRRLTTEFLQQQPDEWLMQFYTYLLEKARSLWKSKLELLKTKPILRLTNGQMLSVYNRAGKIQVYLPTEQESEYPTVKRCFIEHEKSRQFLLALGLGKPKIYEEITYYILPRYQKAEPIEPAIQLRDIRKLISYFLNCAWHQKVDYLNQLKNIPFCRARHYQNDAIVYLQPPFIYLPTKPLKQYFDVHPEIKQSKIHRSGSHTPAWEPSPDAPASTLDESEICSGSHAPAWESNLDAPASTLDESEICSGSHAPAWESNLDAPASTLDIYFLDIDFYAALYQEFGESLNHFFKELGIEDKPRRMKVKANLSAQQRQTIHNGQCTYDYYHFSQYTYDYDIEGLEAFLSQINLEKSQLLWQFLLALIEDNLGQDIFNGQYNWYYRRERYHYFEAKFLIILRQTAWLYNAKPQCVKPERLIISELATHYETESYAAKILMEKLEIPSARLTNFTEEQRNKYVFGEELVKLATTVGKEPADILKKFKNFLAQDEKKKTRTSYHRTQANHSHFVRDKVTQKKTDWEREKNSAWKPISQQKMWEQENHSPFEKKRVQLEEQFKQKIDTLTKIEALQTDISSLKKYSFAWFNALLALEYLLSHDPKNSNQASTIKFSKIEKDSASDKILILKNPSRYIPINIEEMADFSLQLHLGKETKTVLIEAVTVQESVLRARLKSITDIEGINLNKVQSAIIDIKNRMFLIEKLKTAFQQLPYADDDDLQADLSEKSEKIEFILGPPGTGKTTYLVTEKIIPLLKTTTNLKILVLTPTNKVADVLVKKIVAEIPPNLRFDKLNDHFSKEGTDVEIPPNSRFDKLNDHFSKEGTDVEIPPNSCFDKLNDRFSKEGNQEISPNSRFDKLNDRFSKEEIANKEGSYQEWLIRFGVTGDSEVEKADVLKEKSFDINSLNQCVVVTTLARFLYDGFETNQLKELAWDVIFFDEASMMMLAQIVYVLYQQKQSHFIVVGDPFQIQPMVIAKQWRSENIYTFIGFTQFQSPLPNPFPITYLTTQYRSIPPIGTLFSQFTYEGILTHHRQLFDKKPLKIENFDLTEITIIKFPVKPNDNLYRSQQLESGGTYQIYSAILTVELMLYLSQHIHHQTKWKIGIICPYLAQATLVEKMLSVLFPGGSQIQIVTGTVHRFQGDEFDMVFMLLTPPALISSNIFLNNQNILNVALSRAKDYLILLMPDIPGLEKLEQLKAVLKKDEIKPYVQEFTAAEIEQILFSNSHFIAENTAITTHQRINVYGKPVKKYEVRIEDNVVDIQLDNEFPKLKLWTPPQS